MVIGAIMYSALFPPKTEIIEVEVIKEVIVEVGAAEEPSSPYIVHKWVDPDNQTIVYIWSNEFHGQILPMYTTVPPIWYSELMRIIVQLNDGELPQSILEDIPVDWREAIAPGSTRNNLPPSLELNNLP